MSDYTSSLQGLANTARTAAQHVRQGFDFNTGQQQPGSWKDYYGSYKGQYGGDDNQPGATDNTNTGGSQYGGPQMQFLMNSQRRDWEDALGKQQAGFDKTLGGYMDQISQLQSGKDEFSNWMTQYQQQQDQRYQDMIAQFQGMLGQGTTPTAPSQPAPSQPAPSQPAPSQPAPSQPAPSQPAPSQPAPSQLPVEYFGNYPAFYGTDGANIGRAAQAQLRARAAAGDQHAANYIQHFM